MPDPSAMPVLVEALREKNTGIRRNALKALKPMRAQALAADRGDASQGPRAGGARAGDPECLHSGAIAKWKMIGVFENVWDAVHPPEQDALAAAGAPNLTRKYHNAEGKDVGWQDVPASADDGRVNLGEVFKTSAMVCAYAYHGDRCRRARGGEALRRRGR